MFRYSSFLPILLLLALWACQQQEARPRAADLATHSETGAARSEADESTPAAAPAPPSDAPTGQTNLLDPFATRVAQPGAMDSVKKFIRTAEVRGRVRDVLRSTLAIEDVVARHGGFVLDNRLSSDVEYQRRKPVSRDSAIEVTRFSVHNDLTVRVPFTELDTTLRAIGRHIEFLDYRIVTADDITLRLLGEQLAQRRLAEHGQHLRAALQSKQGRDGMGENADRLLASRAEADRQRLDRLTLDDQVRYSTVKIALYQPAELRQARVANTDVPTVRTPFAHRLGQALAGGWYLLEGIVLVIVRLWSVWLLLGLAWVLWRRVGGRSWRRLES